MGKRIFIVFTGVARNLEGEGGGGGWPSGWGSGCHLGSSPALTAWICFMVALYLSPRPCYANSRLVWLPPVGIFNKIMFCSVCIIIYFTDHYCLQIISTAVLNTSTPTSSLL